MNLKKRLTLSFSLILLISGGLISFWIWYETSEQMDILLDPSLSDKEKITMMRYEVKEILSALVIFIVVVLLFVLLMISSVTNQFLKPFIALSEQLETKTALNLSPISLPATSRESTIIIDKLNQLLSNIAQRIEYEKQFAADVAHELKTPLAGMRLTLELMDESPEKPLLLNRIDELLITIERLLQFARANHELHSGEREAFNLFTEVIIPLQGDYDEHFPHPIHWQIDPALCLKGAPSLIYLLLKNLLDNVKFYAGNGQYTIVSATQTDSLITLCVIDNGAGIPESQLASVLERFHRADQSRNGSGLGLNIVEKITQAHHGKLQIRNRTDGKTGLSITVSLPQ